MHIHRVHATSPRWLCTPLVGWAMCKLPKPSLCHSKTSNDDPAGPANPRHVSATCVRSPLPRSRDEEPFSFSSARTSHARGGDASMAATWPSSRGTGPPTSLPPEPSRENWEDRIGGTGRGVDFTEGSRARAGARRRCARRATCADEELASATTHLKTCLTTRPREDPVAKGREAAVHASREETPCRDRSEVNSSEVHHVWGPGRGDTNDDWCRSGGGWT
mmetsp:Transcript_935/g.5876  ORF Transcript_935/g.5876 Transcript_935/m.5876 type:complete len:220 (+) Transcript_935:2579-3238(+)